MHLINKFEISHILKSSKAVDKVRFIEEASRGKVVLDLGCIRHNAEFAVKDPNWLHGKIKAVAKKVVGVDYVKDEVAKLQDGAYDIVYGDVCKPLDLTEKFDLIVAGDLIEHLTNFDGFFENCNRLLAPGGKLLITTPNPFYGGEFHFVAFRRLYLLNPEHTCWIDPLALAQLAGRFGFKMTEAHFLSTSWRLGGIFFESPRVYYDILNDKWVNDSAWLRIFRCFSGRIINFLYAVYKVLSWQNSKLVQYSDYVAVLCRRSE
jgi:SAM-dependent methyltransferase